MLVFIGVNSQYGKKKMQKKPLIQLKKSSEKQEEIIAEYQRYVEDTYIDVRITLLGETGGKGRKKKMRVIVVSTEAILLLFLH